MKRTLLALCLLLAAGCSHKAAPPHPPIPGVETFEVASHKHVPGHVDYPQSPPVGGPHNPTWLRCGVYTAPVPNENAVHSLEHGAVWITYRPDLTAEQVDTLHRLQALNPRYVLISPYDGLADTAVASAWGLQLRVTDVTDARLAEFVRRYAGGAQGGEGGADCVHGATPEQLRNAASPSPSAS